MATSTTASTSATLPAYKTDFLQACLSGNVLTFGSYTLKSGRRTLLFSAAISIYLICKFLTPRRIALLLQRWLLTYRAPPIIHLGRLRTHYSILYRFQSFPAKTRRSLWVGCFIPYSSSYNISLTGIFKARPTKEFHL